MEVNVFSTKEKVAFQFALYLKELFQNKKEVHIALSGGSTPKIVLDTLVTSFSKDITWNNVHLYWGDERCVAPEHEDSNYAMTVEHLISKINIPETNIHRIKGENEPNEEAVRYSYLLDRQLPKVDGAPKFDVVILGMGDDGHTASIFPHEINLWYSNNNCEVAIHPNSGQKRISLTGRVINNAAVVAFLVTGTNKKEKVYEVLTKKGAYKEYPASLVAPKSEKLLWFLDEKAAELLEKD